MPTGLIGYHPERVLELQRAVCRTVEHLLRTPAMRDPLASAALSTVRLVGLHLEQDWLPTLSRVSGSTAMTRFGSFGLSGIGGWADGWTGQMPGPPGGIPPSFGELSNADARAAADAAMAAGVPGVFVGRTTTYEVVETPPSTTIPDTGHDPDAGSGRHDVIVTDHWYFEHDLTAPPAPYGATPGGLLGRAMSTIARFLQDEPDPVPFERGLMYEQLTEDARGPGGPGGIGTHRNVAVGRLTTTEGDAVEIEYRAVSGRGERPTFVSAPLDPQFTPRLTSTLDTEVKILEEAATELDPSDDGLVEIFTELPPCDSCVEVMAQFHAAFPNVQVRVYYRGMEVRTN